MVVAGTFRNKTQGGKPVVLIVVDVCVSGPFEAGLCKAYVDFSAAVLRVEIELRI